MSTAEPDVSPPRPKQKRRSPDERRAEFIRKAAEFFAEEGFGGGTRELARTLGVTQPLLYRYFPSKDNLIEAVYRTIYLDRWRPEWDDLLRDRTLPIRARLQNFYEAYTDAIFTREWIRIYLFSGLKGVEINRWYVGVVETRILTRIIEEYRHEAGLPPQETPTAAELELAWVLHGGIFYYGVRKYIYGSPVLEQKSRMIANALDVFLEGISRVFGTNVKVRPTAVRRRPDVEQ
ncbi:TetR/AcrR family transcriptional regulator [Chelatococcus sp. GCM10030263]|uniref:TetR/AcrR family transcriptional regulator n=1 Tax=Chelatococcus sp. GCM10030263 TaxID=3273387 RepID=UPI003608500E